MEETASKMGIQHLALVYGILFILVAKIRRGKCKSYATQSYKL